MLEEIHLSDNSLRNSFVNYWKTNDYADAVNILQNEQLNNKKLIAEIFNQITTDIVLLENNSDPNFKKDKIIVSSSAPTGLSSGDLWFEEV